MDISADHPKLRQWRLECLGHAFIEAIARVLPGSWSFHLGSLIGALAWYFMPQRRKIVIRNLRIACAGELDSGAIRRLARENFRRTGANMISAAYAASISPAQLKRVMRLENRELLKNAQAAGKGVVLLLSHMGNWEILSRIVHLFPEHSKTGAFYRPLNNPLLDQKVLERRQADGSRMFSKRDNPLHVASFLREGGIVGILVDQRVGIQGEIVPFFGRLTRASPLPSLMARRGKSVVLALALTTEAPGRWKATLLPVQDPCRTLQCMETLEMAMKTSLADVFWLQERWKVYCNADNGFVGWLPTTAGTSTKPHRALLWLAGDETSGSLLLPPNPLPALWQHPDLQVEYAISMTASIPADLPADASIHRVPETSSRSLLCKHLARIDATQALPLDFILAPPTAPAALRKAARREAIPIISLY